MAGSCIKKGARGAAGEFADLAFADAVQPVQGRSEGSPNHYEVPERVRVAKHQVAKVT